MKRLVGFSVVLLTLAGCATVNSQARALIEYRRSGGITGREDRLVIHVDGSARLYRGANVSEFRVGGDTLQRLRSVLQEIRFEGLRAEYLPPRRGADLFEYVLIHGDRRVRTMDTAVPPDLQPLIQLLNGLLAKAG
ncbi:MAG TPA: hypothetical protein VGA20_08770 [Gemmatimonadales bacterium]